VRIKPLRRTRARTCARCAPNTMRIPISLVRMRLGSADTRRPDSGRRHCGGDARYSYAACRRRPISGLRCRNPHRSGCGAWRVLCRPPSTCCRLMRWQCADSRFLGPSSPSVLSVCAVAADRLPSRSPSIGFDQPD
jgi:hypothetical protein